MSTGAYSPSKAICYPERIKALREGKPIYPVHLHLILSDLCQLSCPGCSYRADGFRSTELFRGPNGEKNPARFLPLGITYRVLDDCAEMGTTAVEITGGGEPTLHPNFMDLVSYAQDFLHLHTALITNGLRLGRDIAYRACKGSWFRISIDAATPQTYALVRPGGGSPSVNAVNFNLATLGLRTVRAMRNEMASLSDCVIGAGFVVQKDNWHEIYDAAKLYRELGADNVRISGLFSPEGDRYFDGWRVEAIALEQRAIKELTRPGFAVYGRLSEKIADLQAQPTRQRCWYHHFTLYLGANGDVYHCCNLAYTKQGKIGNVIEAGGLKKLLDRPEVQQGLVDFDARQCPACQFNDRNDAMDRAIVGGLSNPSDTINMLHCDFI
jgi:radical SAM protein with 4Fe4S-binding SPASM domain